MELRVQELFTPCFPTTPQAPTCPRDGRAEDHIGEAVEMEGVFYFYYTYFLGDYIQLMVYILWIGHFLSIFYFKFELSLASLILWQLGSFTERDMNISPPLLLTLT